MTAMMVTTLVIGGLLLLGVFSILGLVFKLVGGVFELFFGLLGLVLGAIGTVFGLLVGGFATVFAGAILLLVVGAIALPILLPLLLVVGKREAAEGTVALRRLGSEERQVVMSVDDALAMISAEAVAPDLATSH